MKPTYKKYWNGFVKEQMGLHFPIFKKMPARMYSLKGGIISSSVQVFHHKPCAKIELFIAIDPVRARDRFDLWVGWSTSNRFPAEHWDSFKVMEEAVVKNEFLSSHQDLQNCSGKKNSGAWSFFDIGDDIHSPDWFERAVMSDLENVVDSVAEIRVRTTLNAALSELAEMTAPVFKRLQENYCAGE